MAGFNRPGSQPPRRRGLFANRSESRGGVRQPIRRVDSAAPTRAAVSYTSQRTPTSGGGSFGRAITTLITRLIGLGAVLILIVAAVLGVRLVISLGEPTQSAAPSDAVPSASAGQPLIVAPDPATVATATVTIRGSLPEDLLGLSNALLRISVVGADGAQRVGAEIELPRTPGFEVSSIPLTEGTNTITAVVVVDGVEKTPSAPISVTRDNTAPVVEITSPTPGQLVSGAEVTVRGTSEAGVEIQLRNDTSGLTSSGTANDSGNYAVNISLRDGVNLLTVVATDEVGNSARTSVEITTNASVGRVIVVANPATIFLNKSPKAFRITATATDSTGATVSGATVCMMITAPGLAPISLPCTTSDSNGRAIGEYTFPENYSTEGRGLILVSYTLAQGDPLEATTAFTVKKKP
ncbi:MAG: Ig-like domain-containing protein [Candidatus Limnocylindrus sp.]